MITPEDQNKLNSSRTFLAFLQGSYAGDVGRFIDDLDAGLNHLLRTDLGAAAGYVRAAQKYVKYLPARLEPRIVSLKARLALWSGDYAEALGIYQQALKLFQRFRDFRAAARLRKGLIEVLMYLGRYQDALQTGKTALRYFVKKGMSIDAAQCMTNIGNVYHRLDDNRRALRYYDRARKVFKKDGGVPLAIVDYNRANIYANLNQLRLAETLYQAAASIYRQVGMKIAENQAHYAIAYLFFLESRYAEALALFERVYDAFQRLGDRKAAAITMLDLVELNVHLNQYGSAIMMGQEVAEEFFKLGLNYEEGKTSYFIAMAELQLEDLGKAAAKLERAERLFAGEGNELWSAIVHSAKGRLLAARGRGQAAVEAQRRARRLFRRGGDVRRMYDADISRLEALLQLGRERSFRRLATQLRQANLVAPQKHLLESLIGDFWYRKGDLALAAKHYHRAIRVVERMTATLYQDEIRFFFLIDKYQTYAKLVNCLIELQRVRDAFLQNLTALALVNEGVLPRRKLQAEVPPRLLASIDQLRASLQRIYQFPRSRARAASRAASHLVAEQRLWRQQRRLRAYLYPGVPADQDRRFVIGNLQYLLGRNTQLVNYFCAGETVGAFVVSGGGYEFVNLGKNRTELLGMIRKLNFVLERSVTSPAPGEEQRLIAEHYLSEVYGIAIEPMLPLLAGEELLILADGDFAQIPFIALCDQRGGYLKERFSIKLVFNPMEIGRADGQPPKFAARRSAAFGVASETLPLVEQECRRLLGSFGRTHLYLGEAAVGASLKSELSLCGGFVHIAAHAARSSENPLFSRILMADGPFFPFDLFGSGVKARLVTLSGCQTAAPGLYYGNSFSLARAFSQAGSQYVLASLWPVADEVTTLFMARFYEKLRETDDIRESYYQAIEDAKAATANPALWGAFVLLGL